MIPTQRKGPSTFPVELANRALQYVKVFYNCSTKLIDN